MKNIAYYHMHLTDDPIIWSTIFIEQMKYLEDYGLIYNLDHIRVRCLTKDDDRIHIFRNLCESYPITMNIEFVKNTYDDDEGLMQKRNTDQALTEYITHKLMFDECKGTDEDFNILYFHSKGSTSYYNNLGLDSIVKHKQYYYWRQAMNFGVLERWKDCVEALETHDVVGFNYSRKPMPHFCGNFWWTKASHVRRLPDPKNRSWWTVLKRIHQDTWNFPTRMADEMWVCSTTENIFDIANLPESCKLHDDCLPRSVYEGYLK